MGKNFKKILLVDDDQDDQLIFKEALSEVNNSIICYIANNGADALEKLNSGKVHDPDIIFLDVNMPVMNGPDCLKELKKSDKYNTVPVVMYSTSCLADYRQLCCDAGVEGYIVKPCDFSQLSNMLKLIINNGLPINISPGKL